MTNRGSASGPSYSHGACHNANKRLKNACATEIEREELNKLRRDKEGFAATILELVHTHATTGKGQRAVCQQHIERLIVASRVRSSETVKMMDENAYITHFMTKNRIEENEARELWLADKANNEVYNETVRGVFCVAVPFNKTYHYELVVELQQEIEQQRLKLKSQKETQSAMKRVDALTQDVPANPAFTFLPTAQSALNSVISGMREPLSAAAVSRQSANNTCEAQSDDGDQDDCPFVPEREKDDCPFVPEKATSIPPFVFSR